MINLILLIKATYFQVMKNINLKNDYIDYSTRIGYKNNRDRA